MAGRDRGHERFEGPPRSISLKGCFYRNVRSQSLLSSQKCFLARITQIEIIQLGRGFKSCFAYKFLVLLCINIYRHLSYISQMKTIEQ